MYQITSNIAYKSIYDSLGTNQQIVLRAIASLGECNNQQIARHLGWEINRVTPRVLELRDKNLVTEIKKDRDKETGRLCIFWGIKNSKTATQKVDVRKVRDL